MKSDYIASFDKFYTDEFKRNNKPIDKHHKKYINDKYAPAWKTIEFMTFGGCLKLFKSLKDVSLKNQISGAYGLRDLNTFENFIQTVVYVRNMCSHGGVLYDLRQPKGIRKIPGTQYKFTNQQSLDASIKVIRYLLSKISGNREAELVDKLEKLFHQFQNNPTIKSVLIENINYRF